MNSLRIKLQSIHLIEYELLRRNIKLIRLLLIFWSDTGDSKYMSIEAKKLFSCQQLEIYLWIYYCEVNKKMISCDISDKENDSDKSFMRE